MSDNDNVHPQYAEAVVQLDAVNEKLQQLYISQSCDESCQKAKLAAELKEQWLQAEVEANNVEQYHKDYIVFTEGEPAYNKMQLSNAKENMYSIMAPLIAETQMIINGFHKSIKLSDSLDIIGNSTSKSLANSESENKKLISEANNRRDAENVFDRLAYFENKDSTFLDTIKFLLYYAYLLVAVVFIFTDFRTVYAEVNKQGGILKSLTSPVIIRSALYWLLILLFLVYPFKFAAATTHLQKMTGNITKFPYCKLSSTIHVWGWPLESFIRKLVLCIAVIGKRGSST